MQSGAVAMASVGLLAFCLVYAFYEARRIQTFHRYQRADNAEILAVEADRYRQTRDYFILSAIAANARTPPDALLRIARDPDPGLHQKRHEWIDMFDQDQMAVMRKVVRNPNSPVEALVLLAASPDNYVLSDVCGDKRTPVAILRQRCAPSNSYLIHWSLARNANAPADVLEALSHIRTCTWPTAWPITPTPLRRFYGNWQHMRTRWCVKASRRIHQQIGICSRRFHVIR